MEVALTSPDSSILVLALRRLCFGQRLPQSLPTGCLLQTPTSSSDVKAKGPETNLIRAMGYLYHFLRFNRPADRNSSTPHQPLRSSVEPPRLRYHRGSLLNLNHNVPFSPALQISNASYNFNPREYPKHIASCQATTRGSDKSWTCLRQPPLLSYPAYMN